MITFKLSDNNQWKEPSHIHRSVSLMNNAVRINYHYSAGSRASSAPRDRCLLHTISQEGDFQEYVCVPTRSVHYLNVISGTGGEVGEKSLRYVQMLGHLREDGIGVRTHLLVPTGEGI